MCVCVCETSSWRFEPQSLSPQHFTSTCTCRVTTTPRVCGNNLEIFSTTELDKNAPNINETNLNWKSYIFFLII